MIAFSSMIKMFITTILFDQDIITCIVYEQIWENLASATKEWNIKIRYMNGEWISLSIESEDSYFE